MNGLYKVLDKPGHTLAVKSNAHNNCNGNLKEFNLKNSSNL